MSKIWKVKSRICFDTTYYVKSETQPNADNILELARDGYVNEFNQEPAGPEYALGVPEETAVTEYLESWKVSASEAEKLGFLFNLDNKPPEDLSFAEEIVIEDALSNK